jgi:16S rRNA (guanine527-N7)-methyltransferase
VADLARYVAILRKWNRTINLTALPLENPPDRTFIRLLVEPLQAAPYVGEGPLDWFDLGSGGGSPAIPLKIVRREATLTMVESRHRKAAFLREAAASLALAGTRVLAIRVEELERYAQPGSVDLFTARALRLEIKHIRVLAALLRPGGRLLLFGSKPWKEAMCGLEVLQRVALAGGESTLQILEVRA